MSKIALPPVPGQRLETRGREGMLVATRTVTVKGEDGTPERIKEGQTFVVAGHWLTMTYPDLFVHQQSERARSFAPASKPRRPSPAEPKPKWSPLVRLNTSAAPTFTVELSSVARRLIGELAFSARGKHETGGALFGPPAQALGATAEVWTAGEPGPATRASRSSVKVDLEHIRREAGGLQRSGSPARWVGHWHTHPDGDGVPSPTDLEFFAWDCRELTLHGQPIDHYVALILTPTWDHDRSHERYLSWAKPNIHAWHVHPLSDDQFTCRRATLADPAQSHEARAWRL